jgi:hypothetical protein
MGGIPLIMRERALENGLSDPIFRDYGVRNAQPKPA